MDATLPSTAYVVPRTVTLCTLSASWPGEFGLGRGTAASMVPCTSRVLAYTPSQPSFGLVTRASPDPTPLGTAPSRPNGCTCTVVEADPGDPPVPMLGHVTSSYRSPTLGRTFGLAMVKSGRRLRGETIFTPGRSDPISVRVVDPIFYDEEGRRRDG